MTTFQELSDAIESINNNYVRASKYLTTGAFQINIGELVNAEKLLDSCRSLMAVYENSEDIYSNDGMISELAFQYARLDKKTKAKNALQYIQTEETLNEARKRIATEIAKTDLTEAQTIVNTITDEKVKNDTIAEIAIFRALTNLQQALTFHEEITDAEKKEQTFGILLNSASQTALT